MWPVLLDMTKEESMQCLRNLELEAYAHLVSALRAQGPLNPDKRRLLKDTSLVLNIPPDRHKAEIRRAINDEKLNTIAYHVTGLNESLDEWAQEGRRTVPLIPRMAPQTAYSAIADEAAENASEINKQLPPPACTERKRAAQSSITAQSQPLLLPETSKNLPFRVPELPKMEDTKKRKLPICTETSSLAQHLLGPSKMSRTQQVYRQRMKGGKEPPKPKPLKLPYPASNGPRASPQPLQHHHQQPIQPQLQPQQQHQHQQHHQQQQQQQQEETIEQIQNEINAYTVQKSAMVESLGGATTSIESQPSPRAITKTVTTIPKPSPSFRPLTPALTTVGPLGSVSSNSAVVGVGGGGGGGGSGGVGVNTEKAIKVCPARRPAKGTPVGQKLIVVSNAQTIQSTSILQKTLSIPLVKNLSVKNFEKFKIVSTSAPSIATASNNLNSIKHKVVTVKTNPTTKKVIPLSQLFSGKGGIKVLPIGGKIVGKSITTTASQPLYIVNTLGTAQRSSAMAPSIQVAQVPPEANSPSKENGKSSVLGDILKASGVTADDFDTQIEEFRIPNNNHICSSKSDVTGQVEPDKTDSSAQQDFFVLSEGTNECVGQNVEVADNTTERNGGSCQLDEQFQPPVQQQLILHVQNSDLSTADDVGN